MGCRDVLNSYPDVSFIDNMSIEDVEKFLFTKMQEEYLKETGEELTLSPAHPVSLILKVDALFLYQVLQFADRAGKMNLLKYSFGEYLDNLGSFKRVERTKGKAAETRICFTLSAKRNMVTLIPAGTRISAGNDIYFFTKENLEISAGELQGEVTAQCRDIGIKGNGFEAGELSVLVDPVAYVDRVENVIMTAGGTDEEDDESLAEDIYLAPSTYSTAGAGDSYEFYVRKYNQEIKDIIHYSPTPGVVEIRILMENGLFPEEAVIDGLREFFMDGKKNIRPLTDSVVVLAPDQVHYNINLTYFIGEKDRQRAAEIKTKVEQAIQAYIIWQRKMGRDINPDELTRAVREAGAKRSELTEPHFTRVAKTEVAVIEGETKINYGGIEDD